MEKVKVVQIGIKGFGEYVAGIVQRCRNIELVGIYDINKDYMASASKELNVMPFDSLEDALSCECDGVILEVPNSAHAELVKSAAIAGKHVFVEKPITNSVEDAQEIIGLCKERGVLLQVGHSRRFMGKYHKVKDMIENNVIGRVVMIEANYSSQRAKSHSKDVWRYSRATCPGGPMLQLGIHAVDTIYYLTGCRPLFVKGLFSDGFTATQNEDVGALIMKTEKDILAYVGSSYVSPSNECMTIYGDDGRIDIKSDTILLNKDGKDEILDIGGNDEDASYIKQFESFADCIIHQKKPLVDGEIGMQNLEVVLNALKSGGN